MSKPEYVLVSEARCNVTGDFIFGVIQVSLINMDEVQY